MAPQHSITARGVISHSPVARLPLSTRIKVCNAGDETDVHVVGTSGVHAFDRAVVHDAEAWTVADCDYVTVKYQP